MHIAILCISAVAICTERVEAKQPTLPARGATPVAICTERVEAKTFPHSLSVSDAVAICTERVEAKWHGCRRHEARTVAICTERVEAKFAASRDRLLPVSLQSARSVWRQRRTRPLSSTGFIRLQSARSVWRQSCLHWLKVTYSPGCNLHGACGGKGRGCGP